MSPSVRFFHWIVWLPLLLALFARPVAAETGPAPVRGVLFYAPDCAECAELFDFLLPALFERYGERLQLAAFDSSEPGGGRLFREAVRNPAPALPVLLVGTQTFSGMMDIAQGLGDGFEALAQRPEARGWPELAGLEPELPAALRDLRARMATAPEVPVFDHSGGKQPLGEQIANGLAVLVLGLMLLALWDSVRRIRRSAPVPSGSTAMLLVLAAGLGISTYTAYTSLADVAPVCGVVSGCAEVQNSEYSRLFGVPMGVLGLLGYGGILITWLIARRWSPAGGGWRWVPWLIALFGVLFSLRLTYLEPFVIGHTCIWCLGSAVSITLALWLLSGEIPRAQAASH